MGVKIDAMSIDRQIDHAFGLLYVEHLAGHVEAAMYFAEEDDCDAFDQMYMPNPMLFAMERELFALMAWTLIMTADLERGRFASPLMNAIHCFEAKTICSLVRDPREYFADEKCTVLTPTIIRDVDTVLLCCVENQMHPLTFLREAVAGLIDFSDLEEKPDEGWVRSAVRFDALTNEMAKYPDNLSNALSELLEMNDGFFGTEYHELNTFYPNGERPLIGIPNPNAR